jgi:hypothetical protein
MTDFYSNPMVRDILDNISFGIFGMKRSDALNQGICLLCKKEIVAGDMIDGYEKHALCLLCAEKTREANKKKAMLNRIASN